MTQEELAKRAKVGRVTIARLEIGQFDARLSTLRRLARALRVSIHDLLGPKGDC